jgi:hypothetical protein
VLALVDVSYAKVGSDKTGLAKDILTVLKNNGGLDYTPRERTPVGRLIQHAVDSKPLITHLLTVEASEIPDLEESSFTITLKEEDKSALIALNRDYIQLTLAANGKAELYFHAYMWTHLA